MTSHNTLPRQLRFEGSHNFRDLGGYPCADGRKLRAGLVYRSDQLSKLSDDDQERIRGLGIRTVIDLRRAAERQDNPDRLGGLAIEQVWLPIDAEGADVRALRQQLEAGSMDPVAARQHLLDANRQFVEEFSGQFSQFFDYLLDAQCYPLVFHCTAGKDRAGFAAATTLLALGASRDTVFHDYLATNTCTAKVRESILAALPGMAGLKASAETVATLMQVERAYLEHAITTADALHGSMEGFLEHGLGLTGKKRRQLQALLLEPG